MSPRRRHSALSVAPVLSRHDIRWKAGVWWPGRIEARPTRAGKKQPAFVQVRIYNAAFTEELNAQFFPSLTHETSRALLAYSDGAVERGQRADTSPSLCIRIQDMRESARALRRKNSRQKLIPKVCVGHLTG